MSRRRKAVLQLLALLLICGALVSHAILWNSNGVYLVMFQWLQSGKGYLTVLYNLLVMLTIGTALGLLMEKIAEVTSYKKSNKHGDVH